jgi:6-pyruvoyltetrahydropterin/6-carboxytetrahydropterin synthase
MHIVDLVCEFTYESAHRLPMVGEGHKCGRMHGHSYHLAVVVSGPVGLDGFVVDFADVKRAVEPLIDRLDHHTLNDVEGLENPTVENQLVWLWERVEGNLPGLAELRLRETAKNSALYRGGK